MYIQRVIDHCHHSSWPYQAKKGLKPIGFSSLKQIKCMKFVFVLLSPHCSTARKHCLEPQRGSYIHKRLLTFTFSIVITFTVTFMYLADTFTQSDLQYVHSTMWIQPKNWQNHASTSTSSEKAELLQMLHLETIQDRQRKKSVICFFSWIKVQSWCQWARSIIVESRQQTIMILAWVFSMVGK